MGQYSIGADTPPPALLSGKEQHDCVGLASNSGDCGRFGHQGERRDWFPAFDKLPPGLNVADALLKRILGSLAEPGELASFFTCRQQNPNGSSPLRSRKA